MHTNLGRAPLPAAAIERVARVASGYSNLEYDLDAGVRGSRHNHLGPILSELTGAEDGMAVNNNAAAVMLVLAALAAGRDVPISRGELIEIGDGFRIPDVLAQSGARLVEVGSTNRTRIGDYARVVGPETGAILRVHQSNFRMVGFTGAPSLGELAALAAEHGVPVIDDLGSGQLMDLPDLADEPTARSSIEAGATVVCFSGDKLLGGPQAGVIVGTADAVARIRRHPLARAVRIDKLSLAALEATLELYRDPARALREVPVLRAVAEPASSGARTGGGAGRAPRRHGRGHAGPRRRRRGAAARARELRLRARRRRRPGGDVTRRRAAGRRARPGGASPARLPHAHGRRVPADHPLTLGTAGHIDHGKTALVAALTGVDTDRLPQEKARGISIELGYAPLELPSGRRLSVVDVPGHERFIRAMVAGATGIDLFLLVVAADDGVMPQTREHAAIVQLLGIPDGVVALTKRDLVDDDGAELARLGIAELLEDGPHADAEVIEVSARTGRGLDALRSALDRVAGTAGSRPSDGPARLPVDRSFSLRGIGTVVTGTLWSGSVGTGDRLVVQPGGREVRVRSVQVHDEPAERAAAGQRVALALVGVERSQVRRGHVVATPGAYPESYRLDCDVHVLGSAPRGLRNGEPVMVHHGTAELTARVAIPGGGELVPGAAGRVQLRLRSRAVAAPGDRVVIRLTGPAITLAGGTVTDPDPPRVRRAAPKRAPEPVPPPPPEPPSAAAEELYARLAATPLTPPAVGAGDERPLAHLVAAGRAVRAGTRPGLHSRGGRGRPAGGGGAGRRRRAGHAGPAARPARHLAQVRPGPARGARRTRRHAPGRRRAHPAPPGPRPDA